MISNVTLTASSLFYQIFHTPPVIELKQLLDFYGRSVFSMWHHKRDKCIFYHYELCHHCYSSFGDLFVMLHNVCKHSTLMNNKCQSKKQIIHIMTAWSVFFFHYYYYYLWSPPHHSLSRREVILLVIYQPNRKEVFILVRWRCSD